MKITRQQAWRKSHPERYLAHLYVQAAIRLGHISKGPCEECGAEKAEAHHPDYTKPGIVKWLCRRHHRLHHARGG